MPLFPYIESNAVYQMYIIVAWNEISDKPSGTMYPPFYDSEVAAIDASVEFGPKPPLENRDAVLQDLYGRTQDAFICPSDPHARDPMGTKDWKEIKLYPNARRNYVWCRGDWIGDSTRNNTTWGQRSRGLFGVGVWYGFKDCHDGTSNTLLFSERCSPKDVSTTTLRGGATRMSGDDKFKTPERCLAAGERGKLKRDATYLDVYPETAIMFDGRLFGGFSTILSPNSPSCVQGDSKDSARFGYGIASASSYHPGGVHVVLADASCRFINDDIDAGFASKAPVEYGVSPYGVWGELGNRSQTETPPKPSID